MFLILKPNQQQTLQIVQVRADHQLPLKPDIVDSSAKNQGPKAGPQGVYLHLNLPMLTTLSFNVNIA